jgi:hypothetical protein
MTNVAASSIHSQSLAWILSPSQTFYRPIFATQHKTYLERARYRLPIHSRLRLRMPTLSRKQKKVGIGRKLTIHDGPPMSDKTVNNFEGLSSSRPTLVKREPIQSLDSRLDVLLSPKLTHKLLCVQFSQLSQQLEETH